MTNEEKAQDIANTAIIGYGPYYFDVAIVAAFKMAEYKDKLLMERLDLEIEKANTYYDKKLSPYRIANHIGAITAITEILGIPFPYDRLHMGFATMD